MTRAELVRLKQMPWMPRDQCKHGHLFDAANTYYRPDTGVRQCQECRRLARLRRSERTREHACPSAVTSHRNGPLAAGCRRGRRMPMFTVMLDWDTVSEIHTRQRKNNTTFSAEVRELVEWGLITAQEEGA